MSCLPAATRTALLAEFSDRELADLEADWQFWARPEQLPPAGPWRTWLVMAGRGFGKTRTGAEWTRASARDFRYVNIIGATADDARDIMVEGESGLLAICPDHERPVYLPSKRRLDWPTGATSLIFTADEPERLRGKQHERLWADEVGAWRYAEAWTQAMLGLRLGTDPRVVATTTPRPTPLIRELMADPATSVTRGSTYDNAANLAPAFLQTIIRRYEGTRLGRQELLAELLTDVDGALWTHAMLDAHRVQVAPDMARIVVAIDPAVTSGEQADETGIVVAGKGVDGHGYVLADLTCRLSPDGWARRAVNAYHAYEADRLIAETNNGGELVKQTIHTVDRRVAYRAVTATRGKRVRAEPIAALYEQGMVHHVGTLPALEDQMTAFVPDNYDGSPDRVDALVWALTDLMVTGAGPWRAI
jgi:predicted phage terminase large subunit-like protein